MYYFVIFLKIVHFALELTCSKWELNLILTLIISYVSYVALLCLVSFSYFLPRLYTCTFVISYSSISADFVIGY